MSLCSNRRWSVHKMAHLPRWPQSVERQLLLAAAIRLYHRLGFIKIAERKDYYRHGLGREDAVVMVRVRR